MDDLTIRGLERLQAVLDAVVQTDRTLEQAAAEVLGIDELSTTLLLSGIGEGLVEMSTASAPDVFRLGAAWGLLVGHQLGYGAAMNQAVGL